MVPGRQRSVPSKAAAAAQTALAQTVVVEQAGATEVVAETVAEQIVVEVLVVTTGAVVVVAVATAGVGREPKPTRLVLRMGSRTSPRRMKSGRLPINILEFSMSACLRLDIELIRNIAITRMINRELPMMKEPR